MTETLFYVLFAPVLIALCGWVGASAWLANRLEWLRSRGYSPDLLPDRGIGRYAIHGWVWTSAYQQLKDKSTTRAVMLSRALMIAVPISMLCFLEVGLHLR